MGGAWKEPSLPGVKGAERKKEIKMRRNMRASDIFISQVCLVKMAGYQLTCTAVLFCYSHDSLLRFHEVILSHLYRPSLVNEESIIDLDRTSRQRISPFVRKQIYETLLDILGFKMLKLNACFIM